MGKFIDLTGQKFGRLIVISRVVNNKSNGARWNCLCDCGKEKIVYSDHLRSGNTKSCGCLHRELASKRKKIHGYAKTKEYNVWKAIKQRCYNPNDTDYHNYGGRGIKVSDRWLNSFENFLDDMGLKPSPEYSIDRIDNDGDYEPNNCKWSNQIEQANNKRNNIMVGDIALPEYCRQNSLNYNTIKHRITSDKWSIEKAINTPIRNVYRRR